MMMKPIMPDRVGAWLGPHGFTIGVMDGLPRGTDILGWWLIPVGLIGGAMFLIGTTRFLRWMLRYASGKHLPVLRVESVN